jgi:glycosyltransferase involved in cell wall biosynthesis
MPYPLSALIDPVKLLVFFAYGLILCRRYKVSHIVATMPPFETGASAFLLAKLLRRKLVTDLMDDWEASLEKNLTRYIPLNLLRPLFKAAISIYSSSVGILAVTSIIEHAVRRRNVFVPTVLAPMGTNSSLFVPRNERPRRELRLKYALPLDRIVVVYCGSGSNPYYRLDKILLAAKSLQNDTKNRVSIVFYLYSGLEHIKRLKEQLNVSDDIVEVRGPLPRCELSQVMGACDVGLVPFDDEEYLLCARSTKLYEYLSSGLYVVSSGPESGELDVFFSEKPECGVFVKPSAQGFCEAFLEISNNRQRLLGDDSRLSRHSFIMENYDTRRILAEIMTRLSGSEGEEA